MPVDARPPAGFKTLDDWLPWLETLSPREIVLGLERVAEMLDRLGLATPGLVINVGGTNGKGSSVAILEALMRRQGIMTGCYTSPHVVRYNERTRIDGRAADDENVIAALERVEGARGDIPLTFFEFGTLATLVAFDAAGVEAWILEAGMGGRLDAVNAVEPDATLITNVSLDHCAWLGDDVESIAGEKAHLMRPAKPAVFASREVPSAIRAVAAGIGADLRLAGEDYEWGPNDDGTWDWRGARLALQGLARPALRGDVQFGNAAAALAVLEALGRDDWLSAVDVSAALNGLSLDGRFQQVGDRWILDVAHNPAAGQVLAAELAGLGVKGQVTAVVGMLADKDVEGFIAPLARCVDRFIAVSLGGARGASAQVVGAAIANATGRACLLLDDLDEALVHAAATAGPDDVVLVTGSFFIVGPALEWLRSN